MVFSRPLRLLAPLIIIGGITVTGIAGFMIIEDYDLLDAIYMTIITITTIGYGETKPLSETGRIFNIGLIISSFATFALALSRLTEYIANGEINNYFKTKRLMEGINHLGDHVIICGFGRNGQQAAQTLKRNKLPYVVIDNNEALINEAFQKDRSLLYLKGNATDDDVLLKAGIERARALISTMPVDADNVFIVVSAHGLNPKLTIISRASYASSVSKLKKAGADHVIMPDRIGGAHMAGLVSKPDVVEFIDYLGSQETGNSLGVIYLKNIRTSDKSIEDILTESSLNVIGLKTHDGVYYINPKIETTICEGCRVFVLGKEDEILSLQKKFG